MISKKHFLIVYFFFQRWIVQGFTMSGIKG
jgi:ABC-type glycerol-3-phosphate transport system permease component